MKASGPAVSARAAHPNRYFRVRLTDRSTAQGMLENFLGSKTCYVEQLDSTGSFQRKCERKKNGGDNFELVDSYRASAAKSERRGR